MRTDIGLRNIAAFALTLSAALIIATPLLQGQTPKLYVSALQAIPGADLGLALVNPTLTEAKVTLTARSYSGAVIQSNDVANPVTLTLPASGQKALRAAEVFGTGISGQAGWVELSASTPAVKGFFVVFDSALSFIDGGELAAAPASKLIFPKVSAHGSPPTQLSLVNTASEAIQGTISLYEDSGRLAATWTVTLPALSGFTRPVDELAPSAMGFEGYAVVEAGVGPQSKILDSLIGFETYRNRSDIALIRAFPESARLRTGFLAHLASQGGYSTTLRLVNSSNDSQVLRITAEGLRVGGSARTPSSVTVERTLPPNARLEERVDQMFNLSGDALIDGYIRFETQTDTPGVIGFLDYGTTDGIVLSAVEAQGEGYSDLLFSQVAEGSGYYTGLALLNPNREPSIVTLDTFDSGGSRTGSTIVNLKPGEREARLLSEFLQRQVNQLGGYIHLTATRPIFAFELFGSRDSFTFLASVPAQGEELKPQASGRTVRVSQGANVISEDSATSLLVPPDAIDSDVRISVVSVSAAGFPRPAPGQLPIVSIKGTPTGTKFQIPVRLTFPLNAQLEPGTQIPLLILDPQTLQYEPTEFVAVVDGSGRTASAQVTYLSTFVAALSDTQLLTVSGLSPSQGFPGTVVTIAGSGFSANAADIIVTLAGANNTSVRATVTAATAASLQAVVPREAITGPVVVRAGTQTSTGITFTVPVNPVPSSVSVSPSITSTKILSLDVRINGNGFLPGSVVNYDALAIPSNFIDPTLLVVTLVNAQLTPGLHRIRVVNPQPGGGGSNIVEFKVVLSGSNSINQASIVDAGPDQTLALPASANLNGVVTDDGLPAGSVLSTSWSKVTGPGTVTFGNINARSTTATFSTSGTYVLRLTASDGELAASDDVTIVATSGNTYYVSNFGNDTNPGTSPDSPWKTISQVQRSLGNLRGGDSVLFQRGGIWYEELDLNNVNGSSGAHITFGNYGSGGLPIIDGGGSRSGNSVNGGRQWCIGGSRSKVSYITIDGFECRFTSAYGIAFLSVRNGSAGITVQNSYIHDTGDGDYDYHNQLMFADADSQANGTKFLNNKVGGCYGHNCIQIHGDTGSPLIQGNECYGWTHNCIDVKLVKGALVDNNVVHDSLPNPNYQEAFYIENSGGSWTSTTTDVTWTRNVVYGSGFTTAFQCQDAGGPVTCRVYNNTVYANVTGVFGGADSGNLNRVSIYVKNNIFDTSSPSDGGGFAEWDYNDDVQGGGVPATGSHEMQLSPVFVNAGGHDFHLQLGSPVIDKGTNVGLPFVGRAPDLGAFEYESRGAPDTTPPRP